MARVLRRTMLRVACCYRTTSYAAAAVVSGIPPLHLLAEERVATHSGETRDDARAAQINKWQTEWTAGEKDRWTFRLIPDIRAWMSRRHGQVAFHLTQMLTGHGCFRNYLHRHGRSDTNTCPLCGAAPDDAEHAVMECDAWEHWRRETSLYLGVDPINSDNMIPLMLKSADNWERISRFVTRIMVAREAEERKRQLMERQVADER